MKLKKGRGRDWGWSGECEPRIEAVVNLKKKVEGWGRGVKWRGGGSGGFGRCEPRIECKY